MLPKFILSQLFFLECTLRCNLNCRHCGSDCKRNSTQKDMPIADFMKVIDEIDPHFLKKKPFIIFTGGEVLMRNDIETCGLELYKRHYPWGIVTNALFLDRKRLDSLLAAGMHAITISLDGFEEEHNWIRQNPDSFKTAVKAIKMLVNEKEIEWDIVTCASPKNIDKLGDFKNFLIYMGVKNWRIFTIFPVGRAAGNTELNLNQEQFKYVFEFIKKVRTEKQINLNYGCEGFLGDYELEVRDNFFNCRAGVNVASVLIDGSISGCPSIRSKFHQGNIYTDSFWEVWNNKFEKYRNREWARKGDCAKCKKFKYCLGNGMHLYDENENLLLCHYNKLNK